MQEKMYIYVLREEGDSEVRYVGKTKNPRQRLISHLSPVSTSPKDKWVSSLIYDKNGNPTKTVRVVMDVIDECTDENSNFIELKWIKHYAERGDRLTNDMKKNQNRIRHVSGCT